MTILLADTRAGQALELEPSPGPRCPGPGGDPPGPRGGLRGLLRAALAHGLPGRARGRPRGTDPDQGRRVRARPPLEGGKMKKRNFQTKRHEEIIPTLMLQIFSLLLLLLL